MDQSNETFPLNDKGEPAAMILSINGKDIPFWLVDGFTGLKEGMTFPFWSVKAGWGDLVAGGEYLMLAIDNKDVPEENRIPGKFPTMVLYTNRPLDPAHWVLIAAQCQHDGHTPTVIRVLWNTGEEFQYENVLKPNGKLTLTYKGNVSSGVAAQ